MRSDRISSLNAPCKGEVGGRTEADPTQKRFGRYQQLTEIDILATPPSSDSLYSSEGLRERLPLWLVGGLSGFGFYLLTLPIDRAKTVLMTMRSPPPEMAPPPATPLWRETAAQFSDWRAARGVVLAEGWRGLYRGGSSVTLLRTFVGQAVALSVYSCTLLHLQG